jgi:hypothetical protein
MSGTRKCRGCGIDLPDGWVICAMCAWLVRMESWARAFYEISDRREREREARRRRAA